MKSQSSTQTRIIVTNALLLAGLAASALLIYKYSIQQGRASNRKNSKTKLYLDNEDDSDNHNDTSSSSHSTSAAKDSSDTPKHSNKSPVSTSNELSAEALIAQLETLDKRGKVLFREQKYMDAAEVYTEALDLVQARITNQQGENNNNNNAGSSRHNFHRQMVTLLNNRCAMYEKGGFEDLALIDCCSILELEPSHNKARTRKLRVLEVQHRYREALVEVCALQLKFMQDNRDKLRMGIPVTPPVPQSKIEELMGSILPGEIETMLNEIEKKYGSKERPMPSSHTIMQLLQSFSGFRGWMAQAARDGSLDVMSEKLKNAELADVEKVELLLKRGRRYAYHRKFVECKEDFEAAYKILENGGDELKNLLEGDTYARVLEWTGMCRHLTYDLKGAVKCYEACSDVEPTNAVILVKRAGIQMDSGKLDEALELFGTALGIDPSTVDALLHRANLHMLQEKPMDAKVDLERCIELRPDHVFAHLRLATIYLALGDEAGAKKSLDAAERIDPNSSEVHSYRGELLLAQGQMEEAKAEFDRAIDCDAGNPTPYVNAALAVMNTPSAGGGPPDIHEAIRLLEKAIDIDPQFHSAYVHLGQLKLCMATNLIAAREVIALYDKGLNYCRTADEMKDILSMRILTVAQVDAASALKMETLNMQ
eukprot:CAMPEP_0176485226 /NCGR_PEP_ID=MMETSP0200_2-20121128/4929_1 /TAXON_ID=947934 /ORGANISM="Chaetoceros sp., Strain GSL56" /LENGTH=652 /DNA_ID=CAMNT_0017881861 /DNA_START=73 /DNA_END=2031 /DNA_ORIENTATION=+